MLLNLIKFNHNNGQVLPVHHALLQSGKKHTSRGGRSSRSDCSEQNGDRLRWKGTPSTIFPDRFYRTAMDGRAAVKLCALLS